MERFSLFAGVTGQLEERSRSGPDTAKGGLATSPPFTELDILYLYR
jgi:hypothetical protein